MKKAQLIVIEGIDGAGKTTQVQLLTAHLSRQSVKNEWIKFPRYETFFGQLVLQFLHGDFGSIDTVSPNLASIVFALDRAAIKEEIKKLLHEGTTLVLDRYATSNMAHQGSKMPPDQQQAFIDWVYKLEYTELDIAHEDIVLFLDVPPSMAKPHLQWHDGHDIHEEDIGYQEKTYKLYESMCEKYKHWKRVECVDQNGKLKPPDGIHHLITRVLEQ